MKTKKKNHHILAFSISFLSLALISWRIYSLIRNKPLVLPPLPANLASQAPMREISFNTPVPILMYHHIKKYPSENSSENKDLVVSPENFDAQMKWLSENGYETVNPDYVLSPTPLSKKPVILTFDDGYEDAYSEAFSILQKYHFQGTFFLVVGDINKWGSISDGEIREMENAGMNFGSHTLYHPDLTKAPLNQAMEEVYASKKLLEQKTGKTVTDFCYPGGLVNSDVENIVINSNYATAVTTVNDTNFGKMDPYRLNRLDIRNDTNFANLQALN